MISYMLDKQGYLIVNRAVVGADIAPFEYSPKPEFPGPFQIFNEADEKATLQRWFVHMAEVRLFNVPHASSTSLKFLNIGQVEYRSAGRFLQIS